MHFINTFKPSGGEKSRQIDGFIPICIGLTPKKEPFGKRRVCVRARGNFKQGRLSKQFIFTHITLYLLFFNIFLQLTFLFYAKCVLVVQVETYFKLNNLVVVRTLLEPSTTDGKQKIDGVVGVKEQSNFFQEKKDYITSVTIAFITTKMMP